MRAGVVKDAVEGNLPDGIVRDAILLADIEPRDDPWSEDMEALVSRRFYPIDLRRSGLSGPTVKCTSTICEIAVVQSIVAARRTGDNWQTHFAEVSRDPGFGELFVRSSLLMRVVDEERVAFFTYLHFDR